MDDATLAAMRLALAVTAVGCVALLTRGNRMGDRISRQDWRTTGIGTER